MRRTVSTRGAVVLVLFGLVLGTATFGGGGAEGAGAIAVDTQGVVHVLGMTGSSDFPSVQPVTGRRRPAGGDAFLATVNLVDAGAMEGPVAATAAPSSSTSSQDRRVRMLFALTLALFLAAVLQTLYLRRRAAAAAKAAGPPTMATPLATVKPQEPAIAGLLQEDLWGPGLSEVPAPGDSPEESQAPDETDTEGEPGTSMPVPDTSGLEENPPAPEWVPFDTGSTPAVAPEPSEPGPAIPPVAAEELSFWDLFPKDLPPVRPTGFPAEDLPADKLILPENSDSAAERLFAPAADDEGTVTAETPAEGSPQVTPQPQQQSERPPRPREAEAEAVIAELLDGPPPTGLRPSAESRWARASPDSDFFIDDLLAPPGPKLDAEATSEPDDDESTGAGAGENRPDRAEAGMPNRLPGVE